MDNLSYSNHSQLIYSIKLATKLTLQIDGCDDKFKGFLFIIMRKAIKYGKEVQLQVKIANTGSNHFVDDYFQPQIKHV